MMMSFRQVMKPHMKKRVVNTASGAVYRVSRPTLGDSALEAAMGAGPAMLSLLRGGRRTIALAADRGQTRPGGYARAVTISRRSRVVSLGRWAGSVGISRVKVAPRPGPSLDTVRLPPSSRA